MLRKRELFISTSFPCPCSMIHSHLFLSSSDGRLTPVDCVTCDLMPSCFWLPFSSERHQQEAAGKRFHYSLAFPAWTGWFCTAYTSLLLCLQAANPSPMAPALHRLHGYSPSLCSLWLLLLLASG